MNTRRFPRTLQQAFGPYTSQDLYPMPERSWMAKHAEFVVVFFLYWKHHRLAYALRIAKNIAYDGRPF
jgi:hypothetical protein